MTKESFRFGNKMFWTGIILLSWYFYKLEASSVPIIHTANGPNSYESVELTNPIRLESVDLLPYETVLKLIISVDLPKFNLEPANQVAKTVFSTVKDELVMSEKGDINIQSATNTIHHPRCRAPISSVLCKVSSSMVGSENLMKSYINILEENQIPGFSVALKNSTDFQLRMGHTLTEILNYGENFENIPSQIEYREPRDKLALNKTENNPPESRPSSNQSTPVLFNDVKALKFSNILLTNLRNAAELCQTRKLPTILVESFLKRILLETGEKSSTNRKAGAENSKEEGEGKDDDVLINHGHGSNNIVIPEGYKLVISPDKFSLYTDQAISDCLFTEKRIYVIVNLPLVREQSKWHIYESIHSKFVFDKKICSVGSSSSKLYGYDKNTDNTVELTSSGPFSTCQFDKSRSEMKKYSSAYSLTNKLCFIPQNQEHSINVKDSNSKLGDSFTCAAGILNKVPLKDLKSMCIFKCHEIGEEFGDAGNHDRQYYEQLSKNQFLLTNVRSFKLSCPEKNYFSKIFERIGSLKMTLQLCDCYAWADDRLYSFPCDQKQPDIAIGSKVDSNVTAIEVNTSNKVNDSVVIFTDTDIDRSSFEPENEFVNVSYLVPITWTKNTVYSMLVEENITFKIKNHKEIIDFDWYKKSNADTDSLVGKYWYFFQNDQAMDQED